MFRQMRRIKQLLSDEEVKELLKTEKRGTLAVVGDEGYPYAVPLDFYYEESENKIYFHCAKTGHKIDAIKNCDKVCFTVWNKGEKQDGDWAYYVKSVIAFGRASLITDDNIIYEKIKKLGLKYYPTEKEVDAEISKDVKAVQMAAISIEHVTGKRVHEK